MEIWHHLPDKKLKSLKLKCVVNAPQSIQIEMNRIESIRCDVNTVRFVGERERERGYVNPLTERGFSLGHFK